MPLLGVEVVLAAHARGELPARWRMQMPDASLSPLVRRGAEIAIERRPALLGEIAVVVSQKRVYFRRVLATRDGEHRLRGERAPFDDGWSRGVVGVVAIDGAFARLAARAPELWTSLGWLGARALSRARFELARRSLRSPLPEGLTLRAIDDGDGAALAHFLERCYGATRRVEPSAAPHRLHLGAFDREGRLVGRTFVSFTEDLAYSHTTFVDPAFRGHGVAVRLLDAAVQAARARGARRIEGHVAVRNHASLAACERVGLVRTGRWRRYEGDPHAASEAQQVEVALTLR